MVFLEGTNQPFDVLRPFCLLTSVYMYGQRRAPCLLLYSRVWFQGETMSTSEDSERFTDSLHTAVVRMVKRSLERRLKEEDQGKCEAGRVEEWSRCGADGVAGRQNVDAFRKVEELLLTGGGMYARGCEP
ncbi:Hypothetical protein NTJ_01732 [Nesidiocoris tenuis]|uniref:Uncharacterized protein n=2 Tax=Nesidiocoris tenuis TaxID=355587 RepID=A0ABN7AC60_9HEMI|nr:Hypothetical protein NTJ_01732 [Nesidiocoris tenuis]